MAKDGDENPFCLSTTHLLVRACPTRGRYAASAHSLTAGTVVARSAPLAHSLRSDNKNERCARCLSRSKRNGGNGGLARCSRCKTARYCGRDCQRADFPLHKIECKRGREIPDAVREEVELLVRTHLALSSAGGGSGGDAPSADECRPCGPTGNGDRQNPAAVRCGRRHFHSMVRSTRPLDAADLLAVEAASRLCRGWDGTQVERALRAFRANNFGILDGMLNVIGSGVYPHGAVLNHSCEPNCVLRYDLRNRALLGPVMEIVALRDIAEGEELTHSYVDLVHPTAIRRERLMGIHGFECACLRCAGRCTVKLPVFFADQPKEVTEWILAHRNPRSGLKEMNNAGSVELEIDDAMTRCVRPLLSRADASRAKAEAVAASKLKQEEALRHMQMGDLTSELRCLQDAVSLLSDPSIIPPLSVELYTARGALLSSLLVAGRAEEALDTCRHIVAFLCVALGHVPNHPLLGLQLFTLGDLYSAVGEGERAREAHMWASDVLQVGQGRDGDMVQRLEEALMDGGR